MRFLFDKIKFIFGLFSFVMLMSCSTQHPPTMRIGANHWLGYGTLYLADDLDWLRKDNLKLIEFPASTELIYAMRTGVIEAAALTLDEVLTLVQDGVKLKVILIFDTSHGGDALIAHHTIHNLADLKNKKIGVENTAVGAIMLSRALEQVNLTPSDVNIVPLTADEHVSAFESHAVDAIVTFEPIKTQLLAKKNAKILFDSSSIPNTIIDVLAVREDFLEKHPNSVKNALKLHFDALNYLRQNRQDAHRRLADRMLASEVELREGLSGILIPDLKTNHQFLDQKNYILDTKIKLLTQIMLQKRLLVRSVNTDSLLTTEYLPPL